MVINVSYRTMIFEMTSYKVTIDALCGKVIQVYRKSQQNLSWRRKLVIWVHGKSQVPHLLYQALVSCPLEMVAYYYKIRIITRYKQKSRQTGTAFKINMEWLLVMFLYRKAYITMNAYTRHTTSIEDNQWTRIQISTFTTEKIPE